jgi:hypothetical protein
MSRRSRQTTASQVVPTNGADLADDQMIERLDEQLRREHPEVFDSLRRCGEALSLNWSAASVACDSTATRLTR